MAAVSFGMVYFYLEVLRRKFYQVDPIGLYALAMAITSLANMVGMQALDSDDEKIYFLYADERYLFDASLIQYLGFVCLVGGFLIGKRFHWLPKIKYELKSLSELNRLFFLNILLILMIFMQAIPAFMGAVQSFLINIPLFSAFFFARLGVTRKEKRFLHYGLIIVLLLTWQAVFYSYLRSDMLKPSIFFLLGYLTGGKNISVLFNWRFIPIYVFLIVFNNYFALFGRQRGEIGVGQHRIERITSLNANEVSNPDVIEETPLSRATNFNQLSQVARLVDQKGVYSGTTLSYMTYAFIPRFLWPEKPLIQIGAWFATEIGLGWKDKSGKYHNSINMTVPGEFYLNFGFVGVITGCLIFGFIFGLFWNSISFWNSDRDLLGILFGSYLLFLGFFTIGADIQIIVTIISVYLMFLFINRFLFRNA